MEGCHTICKNKTAEVWISANADRLKLLQYVRQLSVQGYFVVVYRSGTSNLKEATAQLLLANL